MGVHVRHRLTERVSDINVGHDLLQDTLFPNSQLKDVIVYLEYSFRFKLFIYFSENKLEF